MLLKVATALHNQIKANDVEPPSVAVIEYFLKIFTNTASITLATAIIGVMSGEFARTIELMLSFAFLRLMSGGYHLKSGVTCVVVSTACLSILPHIHLDRVWTLVLTGVALAVVLIFAPSNFDKYAWMSKRYHPYLKVLAAVLVATNFIIAADILALSYILQAALLPFKDRGDAS